MLYKQSLIALLLLPSCASTFTQYDYLNKQNISKPTQHSFPHCYRYGCDRVVNVTFTQEEWKPVDQIFKTNQTPRQEQKNIAQSIGLFEQIVGEKTGTKADIGGTFKASGPYQQDCIDESTNTTIYLSLLEQRGHLKHHIIKPPETRMPLLHGGTWPHRTAVIQENQSGVEYAVDSWFHDNGTSAEIIPLKIWKKGWKASKN